MKTKPAADDPAIDRLLRALADRTRRGLLDRLRDRPGLTLGELLAGFVQSRQALSKHLAMLEAAELVVTRWRGREKLHYLNPVPLQALPGRWITSNAREHGAALSALNRAMARPARHRATAASDAVGALLCAAPGPLLGGSRITGADGLAAARAYLADSANAVREIVGTLEPERGYDKPAGGGFSLAEHLWHLADVEELGWAVRFERLLAERRPRLPGVDGDRLAREKNYQRRPWRGAARRFIARRRHTLRTLARFGADDLARPAWFGGRASSGGDLLAAMVAHDREHRDEMAALWRRLEEERR